MNQSELGDLVTATNTPNEDQADRDATLAKFEIAILSLIFVLIVLGNGSVIIALVGARVKIQRMYYFLLHLSIADLLTAFFNVLPQLIWEVTIEFHGNNFVCKLIKYIQLIGPYLSSYVLVVTAIDRYQAICFPLANCTWTERRAKIMISVAWLIALICCFPQAFIFSYVQIAMTTFPNKTSSFQVLDEPVQQPEPYTKYYFQCWGSFWQPYGEKIYVVWYAVSVFFIPLVLLIWCYFFICKEIWINARDRTNLKSSSATDKSRNKRTLIFHSKLAASLSRQRGERETADGGQLANEANQLSVGDSLRKRSNSTVNWPQRPGQAETKRSSTKSTSGWRGSEQQQPQRQNSQRQNSLRQHTRQQPHQPPASGDQQQISVPPISSSDSYRQSAVELTKDSFRAQNGQANNRMNSPGDLPALGSSTADLAVATSSLHKFTSTQMKSASIFGARTPAHTNKLSKAKINSIRVTFFVLLFFIFCSLPFCGVQLWLNFSPDARSSGPLITIAMLLPSLNSVLNPFIYLLLNRNLLYSLLKMIGANCVESSATGDYRNETTNQRLSISMHKGTTPAGGDPTQSAGSNNSPTTANNSLTQSPALVSGTDSVLRKNRLKRITSNQSVGSETRGKDKERQADRSSESTGELVSEPTSEPTSERRRPGDRTSDKFRDAKTDTNSNNKISINLNANRTNNNHNVTHNLTRNGDSAHGLPINEQPKKVDTVASLNQELNRINVECLSRDQMSSDRLSSNRMSSERLNGSAMSVQNGVMQMTSFNLPRIPSVPTETNSLTLTTKDEQQQFLYQSSSSAPDLKTD